MTPTVLVWSLAGRPPVRGVTDEPGVCRMCGRQVDASGPADKLLGTNWTDWSAFRRPGSDRVCGACVWCCSGRGATGLRMWSIVASPGAGLPPSAERVALGDTPGLHLTNRGAVGAILDTLTAPPVGPWLVSIATSGQKHVLPYARANYGRGQWTVRMETVDVTSTSDQFATVLSHAAELRRAGHPAAAVFDLEPGVVKTRAALDLWRTHAAPLASYRRSPQLQLALWLLTKETLDAHA